MRFHLNKKKYKNENFNHVVLQSTDPTLGLSFLVYSKKDDSVFGNHVFYFTMKVSEREVEAPGRLVATGFRDWKKTRDMFEQHFNKTIPLIFCIAICRSFCKMLWKIR